MGEIVDTHCTAPLTCMCIVVPSLLCSKHTFLQAAAKHDLAATTAALQHAEAHHRSRVKEMQRRYGCHLQSWVLDML